VKEMTHFDTEQEDFWAGEFGDSYIERNQGRQLSISNHHLFSHILSHTDSVKSVLEFGANIGLNLIQIKRLLPSTKISAVEINKKAAQSLKKIPSIKVHEGSLFKFDCPKMRGEQQWDFVLTKGLLIHINPKKLNEAYDIIYKSSSKYIAIVEYYNPTPVEVLYRKHSEKLFKRDFAGEMMDKFQNLKLVKYGFSYHRDPQFPQDDLTWFLLEKGQ
jgi:pseudaminic acid biosynthesis-associated methylase